MPSSRTYKRSVTVIVGPLFQLIHTMGDGLRVTFEFTRDSRSTPDQGIIQIYNLSKQSRGILQAMFEEVKTARAFILSNPLVVDDAVRAGLLFALEETFKVRVFAGYGLVPEQIFQGNIVNLIKEKKGGGVDTVTEIVVGDGLVAYREGYLSQAFGAGTPLELVRKTIELAMGMKVSADGEINVAAVAPLATVTQTTNGAVVVGKASTALDEIAALYGLQWWIRDSQIYYVPQGAVTLDFSVLLQDGVNLLDYTTPEGYGDVKGKSLLDPGLHPGRGMFVVKQPVGLAEFVLNPITGLPGEHLGSATGLRCEYVRHYGDTHGQAWYTDFEARSATSAIVGPNLAFADPAFGELLEILG